MLISTLPQVAPACVTTAADRATRMQSALTAGYGVQYWGEGYTADALSRAAHGLLILEAAKVGAPDTPDGRELFFTRDEMRAIQLDGKRPVLLYLNLTEVEPWRDYWPEDGSVPPWVGPVTQSGDALAAFWSDDWRSLLRERAARLMATGADGLFLDDALNYFAAGSMAAGPMTAGPEGKPADVPASAAVMLALVQEVASAAREARCDALIVVNNGVFIGRDAGPAFGDAFGTYRAAIDGIMIEDGLGGADHPDLHTALREDYLSRGLPVLSLDYAGQGGSAALVRRARMQGYAPYIVPDGSFSSLARPAQ